MPELVAEPETASDARTDLALLSRWFICNGYHHKKALLAGEQDRPYIGRARKGWTTNPACAARAGFHRRDRHDDKDDAAALPLREGSAPSLQSPIWSLEDAAALRCYALTAPSANQGHPYSRRPPASNRPKPQSNFAQWLTKLRKLSTCRQVGRH
jgi:hypothetical protein